MSIHPTMTNREIDTICDAVEAVSANYDIWGKDYEYDALKNDYINLKPDHEQQQVTETWFDL
jgi:hypothetical protein